MKPVLALGYSVAGLAAAVLVAPMAHGEIIFTQLRDGVWNLHKARSAEERSSLTVRPDLVLGASAPSLSPDEKRIAFESPGQGILDCPFDSENQCKTIETAIGNAVRPTWHPTSGELIFVRYVADSRGEDSDLFVTRNGREDIAPLVTQTGSQDDPDVSPDGRHLVYSSAQTVALHRAGVRVVRHLWSMDLTTGAARPLVPDAHQDMHPDFSPDGERIAFASDRSGRFEIWMVKSDGTGLRQVTSGPGEKTWPAWSPDGSELLYTRAHEGRLGLWLIRADGSDARPFEPFGAGSEIEIRDADWR